MDRPGHEGQRASIQPADLARIALTAMAAGLVWSGWWNVDGRARLGSVNDDRGTCASVQLPRAMNSPGFLSGAFGPTREKSQARADECWA